mgnify:CR=1 FL=1
MAITRRQFLQRSGIVTAGTLLGPNLWNSPFASPALAAGLDDRYFVVLFLNGGNDGLNTVVPLSNGPAMPSILSNGLRTAYDQARDTINLAPAALAATQIANDPLTGTSLALHPGMTGFKDLYDRGVLAVIQGSGYPQPNLSHETSSRKWQTGQPVGSFGSAGWVGRYLAANYSADQIPAVTAANGIAAELKQTTTSVLGIDRLDRFSFPRDRFAPSDYAAKDAVFAALYGNAKTSPQFLKQRVGAIGDASFAATQIYPNLYDAYVTARGDFNAIYNTNATTTKRRMRDIAAYILGTETGTIDSRFFQLSLGGFDTHSNQGTLDATHNLRLSEFSDAFKIFYDDMEDMGVADRVCLLVWSEFSRRIQQNSDDGTDHGTQGPMFVIGGGVNGGVYGAHPNINEDALNNQGNTPYSQDSGDAFRSTDFRDVYGTVLRHWFNVADPTTILPVDNAGLDPNLYWRNPNFDMGFL